MKSLHKIHPFRWFLFLWMGLVYIWGLRVGTVDSKQHGNTTRLVLFSVLMIVHTSIYWIGVTRIRQRRWQLLFFAVQGALVLVISLVSSDVFVTFGLYLVLIGMPAGIVRDVRMASVIVVGYVALFGLNVGLWAFLGLLNSETVRVTLIYTGPLALFVGGYAILFIRQARAREQAQELVHELEVAHAQLADYVERVEDLTLTAERQRMARELHDTLAQGLAGLILQLEAVDSHLASQRSTRAREIVQQAMARARATLADARRAIDDLRVDDTSKGDLIEVVEEEISRFSAATGIPCSCDLDSLSTIPAALHEHALRAVTEGLTNVARHAQANQVWVSAEQRDGMLAIEVRDDGIGFEPANIAEQAGHYGLLGMRERARLAGGSLEIMSAPSVGTTIRLRLPGTNGGYI